MFERRGSIAVITLNHQPVNSLGAALRKQIVTDLKLVASNIGVKGIVLVGNSKAFSVGADVSEFGTPCRWQPSVASPWAAVLNWRSLVTAVSR